MIHELKIKQQYADRIFDGVKNFEIRKNDRDYQVGDIIIFKVLDNGYVYEYIDNSHPLTDTGWKIIYIHTGLGMKDDYVVLGIKRMEIVTNLCKGSDEDDNSPTNV